MLPQIVDNLQKKPTYRQVQCRYETLRQMAGKITFEDLSLVIPNKRGMAILKSAITLDGLIADISISAGAAYARAIGATQLRIMNPVNDKVKEHYLSNPDFSYNSREDFCFMDL